MQGSQERVSLSVSEVAIERAVAGPLLALPWVCTAVDAVAAAAEGGGLP